jgi:hypothetical protein
VVEVSSNLEGVEEEEVVEKGSILHGRGRLSSSEEGALGGCSSSIREIELKVQVTPMLRLLTDWGGGWEGKLELGQRHGESRFKHGGSGENSSSSERGLLLVQRRRASPSGLHKSTILFQM